MNSRTLVILTTKQNFVWKSMEEIIPFIEDSWTQMALKGGDEVIVLDIDKTSLGEIFKAVLKAKKIVVTAFNVPMANTLVKLRRKLEIDVPMIFYVHGFSSLGLWPMKNWGLLSIWQKNDQLVTTSSRDYELLKSLIQTRNIHVVPFGFKSWEKRQSFSQSKNMAFYYVGRLSEQKNLHNLLWVLSLLKDKKNHQNFTLDIFGEEDQLGSPNMGLKSNGYTDFLQSLTKTLNLEDHVLFHGFVPREEIQKKIRPGKPTFISPSLHSDENFGMAALRAIGLGHYTILSDWGGHSDFQKHFPERVALAPVQVSKTGPFVEIQQMLDILEKAKCLRELPPPEMEDSVYDQTSIVEKLRDIYEDTSSCEFKVDGVVDELAKRWRNQFQPGTSNSQIFSCYEDPIFHRFSLIYAGQDDYLNWEKRDGTTFDDAISPLVEDRGDGKVITHDPHRGRREFSFSSRDEAKLWLIQNGYACSL